MAVIEGFRIQNFRALRDITLGKLSSQRNKNPLSPFTVVIGKNGTARGSIRAKHIVISGKFFGNNEAELVELLGGGVLVGDVLSQSFGIEVGAKFNGKSAVSGGDQALVIDGSASEDVKLIDKALGE